MPEMSPFPPIPTATFYDQAAGNGDFTYAVPVGLPVFKSPLPNVSTQWELEQDFVQKLTSFSPLLFNTAHPLYPSYVLVAESPQRDLTGGLVRWTRTYSQVPATYSEPEAFIYSFIGFYGSYGPSVTIPSGRDRFPVKVESRLQHDFFLVGSGGSYASGNAIPIIQAQKYRISVSGYTWWMDIDWLSDAPPFNFATIPSRTDYTTLISNAISLGWNSGVITYSWGSPGSVASGSSGTNPGQICAEDSYIVRYKGNIFRRTTRFILAQ
jgi:hypothetical protein